jgi:hypothetical protein
VLKPEDYIIEGKRIKKNLFSSSKFNEKEKDFLDLEMFSSQSNEECQPAFMPIDVPAPRGPIFVFGEYFLRKFYTVFDRDEKIIGLSYANQDPKYDHKKVNIITPYDNNSTNGKMNKEVVLEESKFFAGEEKTILDEFSNNNLLLNNEQNSLDISFIEP